MNCRYLIVEYSENMINKKNKIKEKYSSLKSEFIKRKTKIKYIVNKKRDDLFLLKIIGYDGEIKYKTNKASNFNNLLDIIDNMPIGKIEKIKGFNLYTDAHQKTTLKGTGFKNKEKALETLELIKDKDYKYQYKLVNVLYYRAKYFPNQTKEMKEAMKIFKNWLNKHKKGGSNNTNNINYEYLPLKLVNKYEKLANYYNVSRKCRGLEKSTWSDIGFLQAYNIVKGDLEKLKLMPCRKDKPNGVNWYNKRISQVKAKLGQIKSMKLKLFEENGLPTVIHTNLIMWAYSPFPDKLAKNIDLLNTI